MEPQRKWILNFAHESTEYLKAIRDLWITRLDKPVEEDYAIHIRVWLAMINAELARRI